MHDKAVLLILIVIIFIVVFIIIAIVSYSKQKCNNSQRLMDLLNRDISDWYSSQGAYSAYSPYGSAGYGAYSGAYAPYGAGYGAYRYVTSLNSYTASIYGTNAYNSSYPYRYTPYYGRMNLPGYTYLGTTYPASAFNFYMYPASALTCATQPCAQGTTYFPPTYAGLYWRNIRLDEPEGYIIVPDYIEKQDNPNNYTVLHSKEVLDDLHDYNKKQGRFCFEGLRYFSIRNQ